MILDQFPPIDEFYARYWGKRPFIVKGAIAAHLFERFIDGDGLAALSMEEDVRARLITTKENSGELEWACEHGPFSEEVFAHLGEENWSLLVQNVEQYHVETAELLNCFSFAPRWLVDDIMISYSARGGSVGPHTDSYHVFLVQGIGKRQWKVGNAPAYKNDLAEDLEFRVFKDGFDGTEYTMEIGDVLYIPPHFAHEGTTLDTAMTFSVGFLGPKLSELFIEYGQFLEQLEEDANPRYSGDGLTPQSQNAALSDTARHDITNDMNAALSAPAFSEWLAHYFSSPTHCGVDDMDMDADAKAIDVDALINRLSSGATLKRNHYVRCVFVDGTHPSLSIYGRMIDIASVAPKAVRAILNADEINQDDVNENDKDVINLLVDLYNHDAFAFDK